MKAKWFSLSSPLRSPRLQFSMETIVYRKNFLAAAFGLALLCLGSSIACDNQPSGTESYCYSPYGVYSPAGGYSPAGSTNVAVSSSPSSTGRAVPNSYVSTLKITWQRPCVTGACRRCKGSGVIEYQRRPSLEGRNLKYPYFSVVDAWPETDCKKCSSCFGSGQCALCKGTGVREL